MEKATQPATEAARVKQFHRNKWFFSVGGIGRDMAYTLVGTFLLTYLQFGVSMTLSQFTVLALLVGVIGRIWDGVNDPFMGSLIENVHFKWGKFKPWIFIGAVLTGLCIILMFNVRFSGWGFVVYIIAMYLLWESAFTMNDIGYWSMLPSMTSVKQERDQLSMLTVAFAAIGAILANGIFSLFAAGNVVDTYSKWSIIIVLIFIALQGMTAFCCKETPRKEATPDKKEGVSIKQIFSALKKNDQAMWSGLALLLNYLSGGLLITLAYNLYYVEVGYNGNIFYFVVVYGISNVGANFLYPLLAKHFKRIQILKYSCIFSVLGYLFIFAMGWWSFFPFNLLTFSLFGVFVFVANTIFYMTLIVNFTNCVEYNEYITGERNEALISTLRPFVAKCSDALKYGIQILVLVASGIYMLSQNISAIESQKNFMSEMKNNQERVAYVTQVKQYLLWQDVFSEEDLQKQLDSDPILANYQLTVARLSSVGDCHIFAVPYQNGKAAGEPTDLGAIATLDLTRLTYEAAKENVKLDFVISGTDASGNPFNAGDTNFRDQIHDNIGARLMLRSAVCILPIILLVLSYIVINKKFIITEDYYETILAELEARHASTEA